MTPDERRANEATVRSLRDALDHNLPSDMRQGIVRAIELLSGKPEAHPAPDTQPRDALYNLPITFTPKISVNGKPLHNPQPTEKF
jgi:hypothetical protein